MDEGVKRRVVRTEHERGVEDASRAAVQIVALAADYYPLRPSEELLNEMEGGQEMMKRLWPHFKRFRNRIAQESGIGRKEDTAA